MRARAYLLKTTLNDKNQGFHLAILPADKNLDIDVLSETFLENTDEILAHATYQELEFITNCVQGAIAPIPSLFAKPVNLYMDQELAMAENIEFCCGARNQSIELPYKDFKVFLKRTTHKDFI